jgi:hypothetical protein
MIMLVGKRCSFTVMLLLCGCSVPPLNFSPSNVTVSEKKLNAALISTSVTFASREEATGKLNIAGSEADIASLWKGALDDSLVRMGIFKDGSSNKLSLIVKVYELDLRSLGFQTATTAKYQLVNRDTGQVAFSTDIKTDGRASDYIGDNRVRKSASRSVQANIEEFLRQIQKAELASIR